MRPARCGGRAAHIRVEVETLFGRDGNEIESADTPDGGQGVWTMGEAFDEGLLAYRPANRAEPMQAEFLNAAQLKEHGHRLGYVAVDHG